MSSPLSKTVAWYAAVHAITEHLVRIPSVSPGTGEIAVAEAVVDLLQRDGLGPAYAECGLASIAGDPFGRQNAVAVLRGRRREAVVLLGHIDTVGVEDYGALAPLAMQPDALAPHIADLLDGGSLKDPAEWMFGRGVVDMKSGVAVNIAVMRHFAVRALQGDPPPLTLVLVATPDEETQSAGALAATGWLGDLRVREQLRYLGVINTDYVAPRFPGDPERPIYLGSIGKLLPLFYVVGKATHVGDPYDGLDANLLAAELVRDLSMNPALAERLRGQATPPPVTLHLADLKSTYNVQTAFAAWFYLNVLTLRSTPQRVLERMQRIAARSLRRVVRRLASDFGAGAPGQPLPPHLREGNVWTYAELLAVAHATRGVAETSAMLEAIRATCPAGMDAREATLRLMQGLWEWSKLRPPAVVIAFAPPYYPHVAASDGALERATRAVAARHAEDGVVIREFFPLLSDLSYMKLDRSMRTGGLIANMPLWRDEPDPAPVAQYSLPFAAIKRARIEGMANIGVYGQGAHQHGERVYMPYSFQTVPQMVFETILELAGE